MSDVPKGISEAQINAALACTPADNPLWAAVHTVLAEQMRLELDSLLLPDLDDEGAHYNRGRMAALASFQQSLMDLWDQNQVPQ